MGVTKDKIEKIVETEGKHKKDTGSPEVQIIILSEEIKNITRHLQQNPHDYHSKRGLILKVTRRKKLLKYLYRESRSRYYRLVKKLNL